MRAGELLAETSLASEVALPLLDRMAEDGGLLAHRGSAELQYENPHAIYRQYEQRHRELPSGAGRTAALEGLVEQRGASRDAVTSDGATSIDCGRPASPDPGPSRSP